ncbi:MAG: caspase family protein [Isosphaeraceae bacterium]
MSRTVLMVIAIAGLVVSGQAQPIPRDIVRDHDGDSETAAPKLVLETGGFTSRVTTLNFSTDGRLLAAGGADKTVRIWDLATGQLRATLRGEDGVSRLGQPNSLAFSPDGRELVVGITNLDADGSIRVYQLQDLGRIAQTLSCHPRGTFHVAFSTDGRYLASDDVDGEIIIWDWTARRALHRIRSPRVLSCLTFPTRLPFLVTVDVTLAKHIWFAPNGRDITTLSPQEKQALTESLGGQAVVAGLVQKIHQLSTPLRSIQRPFGGKNTAMGQLYYDSGHAVLGGMGTKDGLDHYYVAVWQAEHGNQPVRVYEDHTYIPTAVALSPDRSLVASGDVLGEIHVWEVATGQRRLKVLTGDGRAYYKVAFDESGRRIAFGSVPHSGREWYYNHYADPERTFDLERRRIVDGYSGQLQTELTRKDDMELKAFRSGNSVGLAWYRSGQLVNNYTPETRLLCFSILRSDRPGFTDPVVFSDGAMVRCVDPHSIKARRVFIGHQGPAYSMSESPDGRFLATASIDRTIRLWGLEKFAVLGKPDFDLGGEGLIRVVPDGSSAQAAGIQVGDRLLAINGLSLASWISMVLDRRWDRQPGQKVPVEIERNGQRYQVEVTLTAGSDFVEPLLSLFMAKDGEWILWTPQGYYDASLGGDRLIGWHVNQGRNRAAKFYLAHQFRKQFYRPDIIDKVLQTGDVRQAIELANAEQSHPTEPHDLRNLGDLRRQEPPRVRILAPIEGTHTTSPAITVRAEIHSQNDLPVSEVTILVNGRPAWSKNIERTQNNDDSQAMVIERQVQLLPGDNTLALVASNAASNSYPAPIRVVYETQAPIARPNLYILAVGISEYAQPELNLRFAHRDAEEFATVWKPQEGPVYAKVETRVLTNKEATVRGILDGMEWLVHSVTQKDVAILFLSAHGVRDERDNYYLAAHEIDPKRLRSTAVRWNEIESLIQDVPGKFLLFVDTCHSGGISGPGRKGLPSVDPLRELVSEDTGAIVLSSSMAREVSLEDSRWGHGAFTRALLDIFRGGAESDYNKDGYLSLTELNDKLSERVKKLTDGHQHTATKWPPTITNFNFYRLDTAAR